MPGFGDVNYDENAPLDAVDGDAGAETPDGSTFESRMELIARLADGDDPLADLARGVLEARQEAVSRETRDAALTAGAAELTPDAIASVMERLRAAERQGLDADPQELEEALAAVNDVQAMLRAQSEAQKAEDLQWQMDQLRAFHTEQDGAEVAEREVQRFAEAWLAMYEVEDAPDILESNPTWIAYQEHDAAIRREQSVIDAMRDELNSANFGYERELVAQVAAEQQAFLDSLDGLGWAAGVGGAE